MLYFYRLSGANGHQTHKSLRNLTVHGLEALFTDQHPKMADYIAKHGLKQSLYIAAGEGRAETVNGEDCFFLREYSTGFTLIGQLVSRLLTVRTEWSRK
jgi:hypothetical protein